jgi:hypothetical protein
MDMHSLICPIALLHSWALQLSSRADPHGRVMYFCTIMLTGAMQMLDMNTTQAIKGIQNTL